MLLPLVPNQICVKLFSDEFDAIMNLREETHSVAPYSPTSSVEALFDGTWYVDFIDEKRRRFYRKKSTATPTLNGVNGCCEN